MEYRDMSATIKAGELTATIAGYKWTSENEEFARLLNAQLDPNGPSGADPNPDYTAAMRIAEYLGGRVIRFDAVPYTDKRVY
jgi:hypothetical protein